MKPALPPGVLPHITDTDPPPISPRTITVPGVGVHIAPEQHAAEEQTEPTHERHTTTHRAR